MLNSQNQDLNPAQLDAARTPRCPQPGEVDRLFAVRDAYISDLRAKGVIDANDLLALERTGKCTVANDHWHICTKEARDALLNDAHHFVRSCAAIAASKSGH